MKNMEVLSMEELEMISGGGAFDIGNMGGAAKALSDDSLVTQSFVWLKNKLFTDPLVNHSFVWLKNKLLADTLVTQSFVWLKNK